ncbi:hypothetical protein GCK32_022620 [Trichostrongylus colubriformis]|uniref:Uncharacterized protein n=1 Tax=Trichostrongylus colubriformis TaxID=6319 RepID=A0AAN8FBC8_TRICO
MLDPDGNKERSRAVKFPERGRKSRPHCFSPFRPPFPSTILNTFISRSSFRYPQLGICIPALLKRYIGAEGSNQRSCCLTTLPANHHEQCEA